MAFPKDQIKPLWNLHSTFAYLSAFQNRDRSRNLNERILFSIFFIISVFGIFVYIPSVIISAKLDLWNVIAVDTIMYAWTISIIVFRKIPFKISAINGSFIFYILGVMLLIVIGPVSSGLLWLFAFPV